MLDSVHLHECLEFMRRELRRIVGYNLLRKTMRSKRPPYNINIRMAVNNDQVVHTVLFCKVNVDSLQWGQSWLILH